MKYTFHLLIAALMFCTYNPYGNSIIDTKTNELNKSGYSFQVNISKVNSKYSEIASTMFRDKLVIVSSKKIGGLGSGVSPITNEPYTDLFCLDVKQDGSFSQPLLFSRILNTKGSEGQVAFSPDEHRIYYTRSERKNILNFKLYTAELKKDSYGKWINEMEIAISGDNFSIENPHITADGKVLYFSSNMEGGYGGYDLYKAPILKDGSIGTPENLGGKINTSKDDKYPYTSKDKKEIYFSSQGHNSIGGYDIFISNINTRKYSEPRNLGEEINSDKDDIAFIIINGNQGVFSSNKDNANNSFNMYHFQSEIMYYELEGIVINQEDKILPNATVVLFDSDGQEIGRQITNEDASYNFKIKPYQDYQLRVIKKGFRDYNKALLSDGTPLNAILKLSSSVTFNKNKP